MKKKKKTKVTQVMYHGERVSLFGEINQLFKDRKGEESRFRGIKRIYFGNVYEMNGISMNSKPEPIEAGWSPTEKEELEYEAAKIAVSGHRQEQRKDMELKRPNKKVVQAVELLRPFYLVMSNVDRKRFMGWVSNECSKKGRRR